MEDVLFDRRTGTFAARVSALTMFTRWANSHGIPSNQVTPIQEELASNMSVCSTRSFYRRLAQGFEKHRVDLAHLGYGQQGRSAEQQEAYWIGALAIYGSYLATHSSSCMQGVDIEFAFD